MIYAGETWCRSLVGVDAAASARVGHEEHEVIRAARGALLDLLAVETVPVSLHLRLDLDGVTVLARGRPGG